MNKVVDARLDHLKHHEGEIVRVRDNLLSDSDLFKTVYVLHALSHLDDALVYLKEAESFVKSKWGGM